MIPYRGRDGLRDWRPRIVGTPPRNWAWAIVLIGILACVGAIIMLK